MAVFKAFGTSKILHIVQKQFTGIYKAVLSIRAEVGAMGPVTEVLCTGYCHEKTEGINTSQPEVKARQSDKRLQSYCHLDISV